MAGLVPAIPAKKSKQRHFYRHALHKAGHDDGNYAAAFFPHSVCVAMRAPSASDLSFAHMIDG
jgi:hypothetical protein